MRYCLLLLLFLNFSFALDGKIIKHDKVIYWPDEMPIFDVDGDKYYLDQIEDKTMLVMFWASWCMHCRQDMKEFDLLKKDFRKLPIEILAISEDYQGIKAVKKFYSDNNIRHLNIFHDYKFKLFHTLGISNLPYTFLIDNNKKIILEIEGQTKWIDEKVREMILDHIPGNHVMPNNTSKILDRPIKKKK